MSARLKQALILSTAMIFLIPSQRFQHDLECRNQRQERSCESRGDSAGAGTLTMLGTGLLGSRDCAPPLSPLRLNFFLPSLSLCSCLKPMLQGIFLRDQSYSQLFFYIEAINRP